MPTATNVEEINISKYFRFFYLVNEVCETEHVLCVLHNDLFSDIFLTQKIELVLQLSPFVRWNCIGHEK